MELVSFRVQSCVKASSLCIDPGLPVAAISQMHSKVVAWRCRFVTVVVVTASLILSRKIYRRVLIFSTVPSSPSSPISSGRRHPSERMFHSV